MKYPFIQQHDEKDCGAACLAMISEYYGAKYTITKIRELIKVDNQGASIYGIVTGAAEIGLNADALEGSIDELLEGIKDKEITFPFIARIINELGFEHFIVVYDIYTEKNTVKAWDYLRTHVALLWVSSFTGSAIGTLGSIIGAANFGWLYGTIMIPYLWSFKDDKVGDLEVLANGLDSLEGLKNQTQN